MYVDEGTFNRLKETAANAIAERDQLKAENDRLIDACEEWIATSNRLGAENAKLREYITWLEEWTLGGALMYRDVRFMMDMKRKELGIKASEWA